MKVPRMFDAARGGVGAAAKRAAHIVRTEGTVALLRRVPQVRRWGWRLWHPAPPGARGLPLDDQYRMWLEARPPPAALTSGPDVTVVLTTTEADDPDDVAAAAESVRAQTYRSCRVVTADAFEIPDGEFVGWLTAEDRLQPHALAEMMRRPDADVIYTDEDVVGRDGTRRDPFFKPGWSPELLLSTDYLSRFCVVRRDVLAKIDAPRSRYDMVLRVTEAGDAIAHVPLPLCSRVAWREPQDDRAVVDDALLRRGIAAGVVGTPKVTILVPTRDRVELLERCIDSIERTTNYDNREIVVIDNDSRDPQTLAYLSRLQGDVLPHPGPFNFSATINRAAAATDGDFLVLLNNDTEIQTSGWIEALLAHAQRDGVAAVGCRLVYPDGRVQHEGIFVGPGGRPVLHLDHAGYRGLGDVVRNCAAVTGACMMIPARVFTDLGGFDERLALGYNDVDFCLRAQERGYRVVYTPHAVVVHHEGATRGKVHPAKDEAIFLARWRDRWPRDPYHSPHFHPYYPLALRL